MKNTDYHCYLCGSTDYIRLHEGTRDNPDVDVLKCQKCSLVYLSSHMHIETGRYYENSQMVSGKSYEEWVNSTATDDKRRYLQYKDKIHNKKIVDFGCGNGGFLRYAISDAVVAVGIELDHNARSYMSEYNCITVYETIDECSDEFDVAFLFHVVEHFISPSSILNSIHNKIVIGGEIIIETPNSDDALLSLYDNKSFANFTYWSPHLCLYNNETLRIAVEMAGFRINWIKQYQRYPLANHLRWLAKGLSGGGINEFQFLNTDELNNAYSQLLEDKGICDTIICSISK